MCLAQYVRKEIALSKHFSSHDSYLNKLNRCFIMHFLLDQRFDTVCNWVDWMEDVEIASAIGHFDARSKVPVLNVEVAS